MDIALSYDGLGPFGCTHNNDRVLLHKGTVIRVGLAGTHRVVGGSAVQYEQRLGRFVMDFVPATDRLGNVGEACGPELQGGRFFDCLPLPFSGCVLRTAPLVALPLAAGATGEAALRFRLALGLLGPDLYLQVLTGRAVDGRLILSTSNAMRVSFP